MSKRSITVSIGLLIVILVFAPKVAAGWERLLKLDETLEVGGLGHWAHVEVIYDKLERVNCYVVTSKRGVAIDCMKAN